MLETLDLGQNYLGTLAYQLRGDKSGFIMIADYSYGEFYMTNQIDPAETPDWLDGSCWPCLKDVDPCGCSFMPCQTMELDARGEEATFTYDDESDSGDEDAD